MDTNRVVPKTADGLVSGVAEALRMTPAEALNSSPLGRIEQVWELGRAGIIDTRDMGLLLGVAEEHLPPAGTYMEVPDEDVCPCCGEVHDG